MSKSIVLIFIFTLLLPQQITAEITLKLQDCVRLGIENNLDIKKAEWELSKMREMTKSIRSQYEPFLNMQLSRNHQESQVFNIFGATMGGKTDRDVLSVGLGKKTKIGGLLNLSWNTIREEDEYQSILKAYNPSYQTMLGLSYTQPLLRNTVGANDRRTISVFRSREAIAGLALQSKKNSMKNRISKAYWNLSFAMKNLQIQKAMLERTGELLEKNRLKFNDGMLEEVDIVAAEAAIVLQEAGIMQAEDGLESAEENLRHTMNLPEGEAYLFSFIYPEDLEHSEFIEKKVIELALSNSPDLQVLKKTREASEIDSKIKENEKLPNLDLVAQYGLNGMGATWQDDYDSITAGNYKTWYIGFKMDYFPMQGRASSIFRQSKLDERINSASEEDVRSNIRNQCKALVRSVNTSARYCEAAAKAMELQRKKLELEEIKFEQGRSASQFILMYQNDLGRSETEYYQAMSNYFNFVADLELITGVQR